MTDLYRLDQINDYDATIAALEDYIADLTDEFAESPEGKAYVVAHPDVAEFVGSWIDPLLQFGYAYRSVTLPRMTPKDVEAIVTELFPQKVTLLDPEEASTAIPELIAFWQFLQRQYKQRHASKILSFLKKIQPKFPGLMNDSSKFGIAKSFVSTGMSAGFDMTTEAGVKAFQQQYNQNLQQASAQPPAAGRDLPAQFQQLLNVVSQIVEANPQERSGNQSGLPPVSDLSFEQELRSDMWRNAAADLPALSEKAIACLKQQTIADTEPGTILRDFRTLLELIGDSEVPVSSTNHLFPQKLLTEMNQRLSEPVQHDFKRPVQKSYPPINGLYLLLRASGLGQITGKGKKHLLVLNPELLQSWNRLNPTEQYMTLLEVWMIRSHEEMLGESRSRLSEGTKCIHYWTTDLRKRQTFSSYAEQQSLNYWPEYHNLALLKMFGFLHIESGKPEAGKGWRVKKIKSLPLGEAMMQALVRAFQEHNMVWESDTNAAQPFNELQSTLQPYFPDWQQVFTLPQHEFQAGMHLFKVSLGKAWRRLAISGEESLYELGQLILRSVNFDSDHLDKFIYKNQLGRTVEVFHPYIDDADLLTDQVRVGDLPLAEGATMIYVFDFGDWWEFEVQLETVQAAPGKQRRSNIAEILESHGDAPPQYPNWDED